MIKNSISKNKAEGFKQTLKPLYLGETTQDSFDKNMKSQND